jgi:hypothetical protein
LVEEGRGRISPRCVSNIICSFCNNPRITSKEILSNLDDYGMKVSRQTSLFVLIQGIKTKKLKSTMHCNRLKGCQPRKTPLLTEKHVKASLNIAKTPVNSPTSFFSKILWRDETKIESLGPKDVAYVWREKR